MTQMSPININDLPGTVNDISLPILYADDTNLICMHKYYNIFCDKSESVFFKINKWLQANLLTLNFNKTNFMQFYTKLIGVIQNSINMKINIYKTPTRLLF